MNELIQAELQKILVNKTVHGLMSPRLICRDGLMFSMQASKTHYCSPRGDVGPWQSVEIGYPTKRIKELEQYGDYDGDGNLSLYGWVPIETVAAVIEAHGGLASPVVLRVTQKAALVGRKFREDV